MKPKTPKRVKAHCPSCGPNRWAIVKGHHKEAWDDDHAMIWSVTDHFILECPACEKVYHQTDYVFSEDVIDYYDPRTGEPEQDYTHKIDHWPPPSKRERPDWFSNSRLPDSDLENLLDEVYKALDADLRVLAGIGIRTVLDRASELLGINPDKSFRAKLGDLLASGAIGAGEQEDLSALADAGSAAAHRGWKPTPQQLDTMMSIIEPFLHRNFVLRDMAVKLRSAVPPRAMKRLPKSPITED